MFKMGKSRLQNIYYFTVRSIISSSDFWINSLNNIKFIQILSLEEMRHNLNNKYKCLSLTVFQQRPFICQQPLCQKKWKIYNGNYLFKVVQHNFCSSPSSKILSYINYQADLQIYMPSSNTYLLQCLADTESPGVRY